MDTLPDFFPRCVCGFGLFDIDVAFDPPRFYKRSGVRVEQCPNCTRTLVDSAIGEELERWLEARPANHPERLFAGVGSKLLVIEPKLRSHYGDRVLVLDLVFAAEDEGRPAAVVAVTCLAPYAPQGMCLAELMRGEYAATAPHHQDFVVMPSNLPHRCRECGGDFEQDGHSVPSIGLCQGCVAHLTARARRP